MCGRYDLSESPAAIRATFRVPDVPPFQGGADLRPTHVLPIIRLDTEARRECTLARWGLVPRWAPDLKFGSRCFNARSETLARAPAFRSALRTRRCLVPMNAFYEWSGPAGHRLRHHIAPQGQPLFALAGLWERWGTAPEEIETFTIITCQPNETMAAIHTRMPVILDPADHETWLAQPQLDLLRPYGGALDVLPPAPRAPAAGPQLDLL